MKSIIQIELIDTLEAADDEALEVEFVGDAHVHVHVQRVVVGDERTGRRAARNRLEDRRFHLEAAGLVEGLAHRRDDLGALDEGLLDLRVHDQVHIALAVPELRIGEAVVDGAVGVGLDDREDTQGLRQDGQFLCMDGELAGLGEEGETLDANDVADVQELLEDGVVQRLVLAGADLVPLDIDLDAAGMVLQLHEGGGAHDAPGHDAAGDADILEVALFGVEARGDLRRRRIDRVERCRIGVDTEFPEPGEGFPPSELLLIALIHVCHNLFSLR